jgi:3-hydroxyisobutyrate dehydrogenase-like beta-hydroxyacid dehydrogenase
MDIGMIGLGRMGSNMVRRLASHGHRCVVHDHNAAAAQALSEVGAIAVASPAELLERLSAPRTVWIMIPAGAVDALLAALEPCCAQAMWSSTAAIPTTPTASGARRAARPGACATWMWGPAAVCGGSSAVTA